MYTRSHLLPPVHSLCTGFSTQCPHTILSSFTTNPPPLIHEHGLRTLAPFLGRSFTGRDGIAQYFGIIADLLRFENMRFDPEDEWVVDPHCLAVSLRGRARFTWIETGQAWDETFTYRIKLAEDWGDGQRLKVREYLIWADTGAAYLASKGQLKGTRE